MTWAEILCVIAAVGAVGSLGVAYMAYRLAALQGLPHPDIISTSSPDGSRSLSFQISRPSGHPEWVVTSASVSGNWRRRPYLARGSVEYNEEVRGKISISHRAIEHWQHRIIFDPPLTEGSILLRADAPDCEVRLLITLRTLPSPTVVRRFKSERHRPQDSDNH